MSAPGYSRSLLLSQAIMLLAPAMLGVFWPLYAVNRDLAIPLLRPVMLTSSLLLALLWSGKPATRAEWQLGAVMAVLVIAMLVPSLLATDPDRALKEWLKLGLMAAYCVSFARALRHRAAARLYGIGLVVAACIIGALLLGTYVGNMGLTLPTYEAVRHHYKAVAINSGVMVNPAAFSCMFCFLCALCILRPSKLLWMIGIGLLIICSVFTGTRMPPLATAASLLLIALIAGMRSRKLPMRVVAWMIVFCACTSLAAVVYSSSRETTFRTMSKASEGRWDVWSVALDKFAERPLFGYGYVSWRDDLVSRLPGEYKMTHEIAAMVAGGYHNEFMTALAEQGIFGAAAVIALFAYVVRCAWLLAFRRWETWRNGQWALFAAIFLVLRANVEVPGLFGYAQEPADFLAYSFVAILVASLSAEEDHLRALRRQELHTRRSSPAVIPPTPAFVRVLVAEGAD